MKGKVGVSKLEKVSDEGIAVTFILYPSHEVCALRIGSVCELEIMEAKLI